MSTQTRERILPDSRGLTIQEMARQSGLSEHTLRYYECIGLLAPIPRHASSGHRRYSPETVHLVESLSCLRGVRMPLRDIRRFLHLRQQGADAAAEQQELFASHHATVAAEMEMMQLRLEYLAGKVAYWNAVERGDTDAAEHIRQANSILACTLSRKAQKEKQ